MSPPRPAIEEVRAAINRAEVAMHNALVELRAKIDFSNIEIEFDTEHLRSTGVLPDLHLKVTICTSR